MYRYLFFEVFSARRMGGFGWLWIDLVRKVWAVWPGLGLFSIAATGPDLIIHLGSAGDNREFRGTKKRAQSRLPQWAPPIGRTSILVGL